MNLQTENTITIQTPPAIGETFRIVKSTVYKPSETFKVKSIYPDGTVVTLNRHGDIHSFARGISARYQIEILEVM